MLDPGYLGNNVGNLSGNLIGALLRRGIRKLGKGVEIAVILFRNEGGRQLGAEEHREGHHAEQEDRCDKSLPQQESADSQIAASSGIKGLVKGLVKGTQRPLHLRAGAQQHGTKRGTEAHRIEGRDDDRDGNRQRKLLIETASDARKEDRGDEDGGKNQRRGDQRACHLFHGLHRRILWRKPLLNVMLNGLHDDNGVINHESDCQDKTE